MLETNINHSYVYKIMEDIFFLKSLTAVQMLWYQLFLCGIDRYSVKQALI